MGFEVRDAQPADAARISDWTRDTFAWGDYVGDSVAEWIVDGSRHVLVAVDGDDVPVAMAAVRMLSPTEGWLSAARVRPELRRRGLGSLLNDASVAWICDRGGKVARLAVEDDNDAAMSQVRKLGYRRTSTWVRGVIENGPIGPSGLDDRVSPAGRPDVDPGWMYWSTSELYEAGRGLLPSGWTWRRCVVGDLLAAAEQHRFFQSPAGWVIVEFPAEDEVEITWTASSPPDFPRLLTGVAALAAERGIRLMTCLVPQTGWSGEALRRAGASTSEYLVFAKAV